MTIQEIQNQVDEWIRTHGIRYFDERTNTLLLVEEVGEFCRLIARKYGEQSFKKEKKELQVENELKEELADILFVVVCLANQLGYNLEDLLEDNLKKKTTRDHSRHLQNPKLKERNQ